MFKNSFKLVKKIIFPFLACIALPTTIHANVDSKVAEFCLKAADFSGCVESMSGTKKNNPSPKSGYLSSWQLDALIIITARLNVAIDLNNFIFN